MKKTWILLLAVVLLAGLLLVCKILDGRTLTAKPEEPDIAETTEAVTETTVEPQTTAAPAETEVVTAPETTEEETAPTAAALPQETLPAVTVPAPTAPPATQAPGSSGSREDEFPLTPIG